MLRAKDAHGTPLISTEHVWLELDATYFGKTERWIVHPKSGAQTILGHVRWFGRWRKYCFFPAAETVFDHHCLRIVANVCEELTREHMQSNKQKEPGHAER